MFKQIVWYQKGHKAEGIEFLPQTRILQSLYFYIYIYIHSIVIGLQRDRN